MTDEEEAAVTLTQLGLRVSGLILAQDPVDAQLQQSATAVDEHRPLYDPPSLTTARTHHPPPEHSSPPSAPQ
jgi:hypothetical protein